MTMDSNEEGKKVVGKTVSIAWIDGGTVYIEFTDGTVLDYEASDGGYSCWDLVNKDGEHL